MDAIRTAAGVALALALIAAGARANAPPAPTVPAPEDSSATAQPIATEAGPVVDAVDPPSDGAASGDASPSDREPGDAVEVVRGDRVSFAGTVVVPAGQVRYGDVVSLGGTVRIEGRVRGAVVVVGGSARIDGEIDRDLVAVLSDVSLGPETRIGWQMVSVLGSLEDGGARVGRDYVNIPLGLHWPGVDGPFRILLTLWLWTKAAFIVLVFVGVVVVAALAPDRVRRLADESRRRAGFGLLIGASIHVVGIPVVVIALIASVVGLLALPVVVLAGIALQCLGLAAVLVHLGQRMGRAFGRDLSLFGGLMLGFLVFAVVWFLPVVGFLVWTVLTWIAAGILVTGRLGAPSSPPPPAAPAGG